nr:hypothetical protein [Tanacetum cinerariifolium]
MFLRVVPWLTLVRGDSEEPESDGVGVGKQGTCVLVPYEVVLAIGFGQWVQMCLIEGRMDQEVVFGMMWLWDKRVVAFECLEVVDFLLNTFFFEKVKVLGARGVVKASSLGLWMMLYGVVDFWLNTFFFEKVKVLGARGVVKASSLGVWMMLYGGIEIDDTALMRVTEHKRLVDLSFMTGKTSGSMVHGTVVSCVVMINVAGVDVSSFTLLVVDSVLQDWLAPVLPEDIYVKDMELDVRLGGENAFENEDVYGSVVMVICLVGRRFRKKDETAEWMNSSYFLVSGRSRGNGRETWWKKRGDMCVVTG